MRRSRVPDFSVMSPRRGSSSDSRQCAVPHRSSPASAPAHCEAAQRPRQSRRKERSPLPSGGLRSLHRDCRSLAALAPRNEQGGPCLPASPPYVAPSSPPCVTSRAVSLRHHPPLPGPRPLAIPAPAPHLNGEAFLIPPWQGGAMSSVRVLVGTRKGAFILTSDGKRERWNVERPALRRLGDLSPQGLAGRSEPHLRVAVQRLVRPEHPALRRRRRQTLGSRWATSSSTTASPRHAPVVRRHAAPVGVQARLAPRAVADRSRHRVRRRRRRRDVPLHRRRQDLARAGRAARHATGPHGQPGAGGMCLHTILLDPDEPERIYIAISAAGAFRTDDGGKTWRPINRGLALRSTSPTPTPRWATASTASRCTRRAPTCCSCRSTGT